MGKKISKNQATGAEKSLRQRAEELLKTSQADVAGLAPEEIQALVHELQVRQIELELQNEELRDVQTALGEARDRFSDLYNFAPVGYLIFDKNGGILEANLRATSMLATNRQNLVGEKLSTFLPPHSQDAWVLHRQAAFETQSKQICELEIQPVDHSLFWARLETEFYQPTPGGEGELRTALIDITEQKRAEETLHSLNQQLEEELGKFQADLDDRLHEITLLAKAVANLAEGVVITDDELDWPGPKIRFVNDAMVRITGYSAEELVGQTPRILQGEATDHKTLGDLKQSLASGRPYVGEVVNYRKDGTPYHAELFIVPLFNTDGRRTNFVSIHRDITERKQAEEALRASEERNRAILNTAADAIIVINHQGLIDAVNPATERIFGYRENELIGQNVKMLMPSPYRDEHDKYLRRYLETGEAKIIGIGREVEGRRKDGHCFPIDLAVSEVDHLGLFMGIVRDITERKVEQERLIQSERLAQLGEAMAGLTHESRNALARSQSNLRRLARRLKGQDELLEFITGALDANDDVSRQFEEVRAYAAPLRLQRTPVSVVEIIRQAWTDLAGTRGERTADLIVIPQTSDDICEVDPFPLRNAFRNILENALAACADPVEVTVELLEKRWKSGPILEIRFRDNGPGLSREVKSRAFEPFFTTKTRGTGLGLAIVRRTIEAHGGEVAFGPNSRPGAEIRIFLPRIKPQ